MPKGKPLYDTHTSLNLDVETSLAIDKAAAAQERTKSDWIRFVLRRELRQLGLLTDPAAGKRGRHLAT